MQELDYESAKVSFVNAISIDETDLEAYRGLMLAYSGLGDLVGLRETYDIAAEMIRQNIDTYDDDNKSTALEILRYVREVYGDDLYAEIEAAELAYAMFPDNEEFKNILIDDYYLVGMKLIEERKYADGINYLEKALALGADIDLILANRDRAVKDYISYLFDKGDYNLVMEIANKYKGIVLGIDDKFIDDEIKEIKRIKAEDIKNQEYMKIVFETMQTEDYISMLDMYNSEECQAFLQRMTRKVYYYFPDGNGSKSGMGAACYYDNHGYYFYYGNYNNGKREGYGTTFRGDGNLYTYFKGTWVSDKPNGTGEEISRGKFFTSEDEYSETAKGNLVNGYWDGHIERILKSGGYSFDLSFDSIDGIPTKNRTEEYEARISQKSGVPDGMYIFAFDVVENEWSWRGVWSCAEYGEKSGTIGF